MTTWTRRLVPLLLLGSLMGFAAPVYAADAANAAQDHREMAAKYEAQIKDLDGVIAEHQKMKTDYKERYYVNDKITPPRTFEAMMKHCDAIIQDATKLRGQLDEMAKWHKLRAAELEGK